MNKKIYSAAVGAILTVILLVAGAQGAVSVFEAESMTVIGAGSTKAVTDGWALMGAATLTQSIVFTAGSKHIEIIARGDYAGDAWPILEVKIGDAFTKNIVIDSASWKTFEFDVDLAAGTHNATFRFTNDYYVAPADRNFYMDKVTVAELPAGATVALAWDANVEPDLAGYKIYVGTASRKTADPAAMVAWCTAHEPTNTECLKQWQAVCKDAADQACHVYLFSYNRVEDVKNVVEYTLKGLELETPYYLAAMAYDKDGNTSLFSEELIHTAYGDPAAPGGIKGQAYIPPPDELHVTKEQTAITFEHDPGD